ncbi:non-canonical purine NTP pyrophosphatase [Pseudoclavibacter endophyticus]|uniref:dITP/XTP pyrophosphatase n=1 Tax=Pseudoclavibacter endophyticus TaxID=1778590 RepID=A0A6H9WHX3_9MICO|nr:non-canonical purine NTP pyrophosphatase [Pseudoclavibacter endophyticus]
MPVVLASHNAHKLEELRRILGPRLEGIELRAYDGPEPAEVGVTFEANALIKARAAAEHTGLPAIADDSGICVDVLGGAPGIFSARWSGPAKDARANVDLLLWQLTDVPDAHRTAAFTAAAAMVVPSAFAPGDADVADAVRGEWRGRLLRAVRGEGGFGYDPIFAPDDGDDRSAAELSADEKDARSHRRRAFEALLPRLRASLGLREG